MNVTIRQIAEQTGVSRGTVDRVLNGRPGVKPEVRQRVQEVARQLNYVPNTAAKALAYSKKPVLFGIVMPPEEIRFFDDVREGIRVAAAELKDLGIRLAYKYVNIEDPEEGAGAIRELVKSGAAGIMFAVRDDEIIRLTIDETVASGVPVVTFNTDVERSRRICFVGQDLYNSGRIAAGLLSRIMAPDGKIVIVSGSMGIQAHRSRVEGFQDWIADTGSGLQVVQMIEGYNRYKDTYTKLCECLQNVEDIGGIYVAAGDIRACMDATKHFGRGRIIRFVCNDTLPEVIQGMREGIIDFTIGQDPFQQGYRSLRILYEYIFHRKSPEREYMYCETHIKILESL